tara:strand:- start:26 stop:814 length:789 start_codon:yes stop_codon:yes gene_type:complete
MKKVYIYTCGYYGRQIFRKIKKKYKVLGFIDQKKKSKKLFNKKIYLPKDIKKYDYIFFSGFKKSVYLNIVKKYKFNLDKSIFLNTSKVKIDKKYLKLREKVTIKILSKITKILNSNLYNYFFNCSSLLAIVRKDDFSYYGDVDIAVEQTDLIKLANFLKKNKIFRYIKFKKNQIVIQSQFGDNFNFEPAVIDLMSFEKNKRSSFFNKNTSKAIKINNRLIYKTNSISYKKLTIKVPKKINEYLTIIYGKNFIKKPINWQTMW